MVYAVFLLLLSPLLLHAQAEWEHLPEPYAGKPITLTLLDEGVLLSTEFDGLFLSTDDGRTWEPHGTLDGSPIIAGRLGDGALFAVTDDEAKVFRLIDRATSIELANNGLAGDIWWGFVADNDSAFLLTSEGLFISGDDARSWRRLDLDFGMGGDLVSVGGHGEQLIVVIEGRAWYSTDLGVTFREISDSLPESPIGAAFLNSGDLLVSFEDGLYVSRDSAESFSLFGLEGETPVLFGEITEDQEGYLWLTVATGQVYRVSPDGSSSERINLPTSYAYFIRALESGTVLISDNATGVWRSTDAGATFELTGVPYSGHFGRIMTGADRRIFVPINYGLATSTDQGLSWSYRHETIETEEGTYEDFDAYQLLDDGTVVGVGEAGSFVRWHPDGESDITTGVFSSQIRSLVQLSETDLFAFAWDSTFGSTDGGETWTTRELDAIGGAVDDEGTFWIIEDERMSGAWLQYSTDRGVTFERIPVPDFDDVRKIVPLPEGGVMILGKVSNDWALSRSSDQGETWIPVTLPCQESSFLDVDVVGYGPGLTLNGECGIYLWDRTEHLWKPLPFPLPDDENVYSVGHTGSYLFIGTGRGLYRIAEESMSVPDRTPPSPGFSLSVRHAGNSLDLLIRSERAQGIDFELYTVDGRRLLAVPGRGVAVGETRYSIPLPERLRSGAYILRGETEGGAPVSVPFDIVR